jgi:hypothetical protein
MWGFLIMLFSKIYDMPKFEPRLHVRRIFGFSGQKFVHPPLPPFSIPLAKHVPQKSKKLGDGRS